MPDFKSFDSLESMQAYMAEQHEAAMASMGERQKELLPKRKFYWVRPYPQMDMFIFGAYDLDDWIAREKSLASDEDPFRPGEQERIEYNNLVRGYKSGTAYSIVEPGGEIGDTHVSTMYEISEQAFNEAKADGWVVSPTTRITAPTLHAELIEYARAERDAHPLRTVQGG